MSAREPALLLISPGIIKWTDTDFGLPHLVALGSWVQAKLGLRVEILDLGYEGSDHLALQRSLEELGPFHAIGVSCYSSFDYRRVVALARFLRERWPGVPLVAGGYHASAVPSELLPPHAPFDAVVVGEGERPLQRLLERILGGDSLEGAIVGPEIVPDLDELPPYDWDLLGRYWPRAERLGRKLQLHLSRGCPYRCAFCMERAKGEASWRAFSPERALDELQRLAARVELGGWMVNLADPLFGFRRGWRRQVLEGIIAAGLQPRQFWTLTRADDLGEADVELLARARFSIGIGLESGCPDMLRIIGKTRQPEAYLQAMLRLAALSRQHGLTWAANVIVGHPGETPASMEATARFVERLYLGAAETCGWLSVDPFRLYPGSGVHGDMEVYHRDHGTVFHTPTWWQGWYDHAFRAEWVDPGAELDFAQRIRGMHRLYGPLLGRVQARFRGQEREVDRVFERSMAEQRRFMDPAAGETMIRKALRAAKRDDAVESATVLPMPLGLQVRDPWIRKREEAVRRMLDQGVLRSQGLVEALLQVGPERFMPAEAARVLLEDRTPAVKREGLPSPALAFRSVVLGMEGLQLGPGERVADLAAAAGWVAALLAEQVGPEGRVSVVPRGADHDELAARLELWPQVAVEPLASGRLLPAPGPWDALWIGAGLPRVPVPVADALRSPGGRAVMALGPRFRPQDLVVAQRTEDDLVERSLARTRTPVLGGPWGWVPWPEGMGSLARAVLRFERRAAPALCYRVLARLDLGFDAANLFDPSLPEASWTEALLEAWRGSPGRIVAQVFALRFDDVAVFARALEERPPVALRGPENAALCRALAAAVRADAPAFHQRWREPGGQARLDAVAHEIGPALRELRGLLYAGQDRDPPPLRVLDCPALGPAGRASTYDGERLVAVSLAEAAEHVLMQVLHEEVHPVTDPLVRLEHQGAARDTRVGSEGHALHQQLEGVAIAATQALLEARAPSWLPAFERWRSRWTGIAVARGEGGA